VRGTCATALILSAMACGDFQARLGPGISVGFGDNSTSQHGAIAGVWTRVVVLSDHAGNVHSSRTTWEFRSDGSATRTLVTQNVTAGISDVLLAYATWHTEGSTLVITFRAPDSGTSRFAFAVFGNVLSLDGRDFVRIG
jgi:hypothetical protein